MCFYKFPNQLERLNGWENSTFKESSTATEVVLNAAKNSFESHKKIFEELENSRIEVNHIVRSFHCARFFQRVVLPAAVLTTAALISFRS